MVKIKLKFVRTCSACPEQYDVYHPEGYVVGYVRLRHGILTCTYPDVGGEELFTYDFDCALGEFDNEDHRKMFLRFCADNIRYRLKYGVQA